MTKILLSLLAAVGFLAACSTDTGLTYTANKVKVAGQPEAYRVTCSGLFESQKSCMAAATRICDGHQVIMAQSVDGMRSGQGANKPRELTFMCQATATPPQAGD